MTRPKLVEVLSVAAVTFIITLAAFGIARTAPEPPHLPTPTEIHGAIYE
ncbi:hypothetical protein [Kiloniella majae]|nr:hypothetical protein [Kiloniella majae]